MKNILSNKQTNQHIKKKTSEQEQVPRTKNKKQSLVISKLNFLFGFKISNFSKNINEKKIKIKWKF